MEHTLRKAPRKQVTIDGKGYGMEIGNLTFVLAAQDWADSMEKVGEHGDDMFEYLSDMSVKGYALVSMVFGKEAADELVGGENAVNILRVLDVLSIAVQEATDAEASSELSRAISEFADTGDED